MEKSEISFKVLKNVTKEKKYSDYEIKVLQRFIKEFESVCGEYLNRDELIKRLMENFNGFAYVRDMNRFAAVYSIESGEKNKKVLLNGSIISNTESEMKSAMLFHELFHVVTRNEKYKCTGFDQHRENVELNQECLGRGINEATTEYATIKRNQICKFQSGEQRKFGFYEYGPELIRELDNALGEGTLFNTILNCPQDLNKVLGNNAQIIVNGLDYLYDQDSNVMYDTITSKAYINSERGRDVYSDIVQSIIEIKCQNITDMKEKIQIICDTIQNLSNGSMKIGSNFKIYSYLYEEICKAVKSGIKIEDIIENISDKQKIMIQKCINFNRFKYASTTEIIELLNDKDYINEIKRIGNDDKVNLINGFDTINYGEVEKNLFEEKILEQILPNFDGELRKLLVEALPNGVGEELIKKGIDIHQLDFNICYSSKIPEECYGLNLFVAKDDEQQYIGTILIKDERVISTELIQYDDYNSGDMPEQPMTWSDVDADWVEL